MKPRKERQSVETGDVVPCTVLENLRDIVNRRDPGRRELRNAYGKAAGIHECSPVRKRDRGGIPTAVVHDRAGAPFIRDGIVKRGGVQPLAVKEMAAGHYQSAVFQEGMPGTEEIDSVALGI